MQSLKDKIQHLQSVWTEHFSFSALKSLAVNEMMFYKNYVLREREVKQRPWGMNWNACHHSIEYFLKNDKKPTLDELLVVAWEYIEKEFLNNPEKKDSIERGLKHNEETLKANVAISLWTWFDEIRPLLDTFHDVISEQEIIEPIVWFPIKWFIDLIATNEKGEFEIRDRKFKAKFDNFHEYKLQLALYAMLFKAFTGEDAKVGKMVLVKNCKASMPKMLQADLRSLMEKNNLERKNNENWKFLKNDEMKEVLIEKWILEAPKKQMIVEVNFEEEKYLFNMVEDMIEACVERTFDLLVEWRKFIPNVFEGWKAEETFKFRKGEYCEPVVPEDKKEDEATIEDAVF